MLFQHIIYHLHLFNMNILINDDDTGDELYNQIGRIESGMLELSDKINDIQEDVSEIVLLLLVIILFVVVFGVSAGIYIAMLNIF